MAWGQFQTGFDPVEEQQKVATLVWDTSTLSWVKMTQPASGFGLPSYDAISLARGTTTDTFTYYVGGLTGTLVATVTITYTDSTKATMSSVVKT